MKVKLKDNVLKDILGNIEKYGFATDGCACGEWGYKLDDNLHMYVYRSCRKSGSTPDEKLWHLHGIDFYKKAEYFFSENNGIKYLDSIDVEEEDLLSATLDSEQWNKINNKLKEISYHVWGNQYRNEDLR